ncbi:hypothetical protein RFI_33255 [Reticulomyxa filosa]|nr:hypothetical protein RFI_33255 [Reticulomyxa filosa]|eukprot:ETO04147.1 hypothetical protein RFI_33255 [Reticulomyxa filosa]
MFEDKDLTFQSIHGFYLRISEDTFKKISGPKAIFFQEKGDVSEIFAVQDASKLQPNGLPLANAVPANNKLHKTNVDGVWRLHTSDGKIVDNVNIIVLQTETEDELDTIYNLMRRYYQEIKLENNRNNDIQIVELNNG